MQSYLELVNQYGNGIELVAIILVGHCACEQESSIRVDLQASRRPGGGGRCLAGILVHACFVGGRLRGRKCRWRINATANACLSIEESIYCRLHKVRKIFVEAWWTQGCVVDDRVKTPESRQKTGHEAATHQSNEFRSPDPDSAEDRGLEQTLELSKVDELKRCLGG